MFVLVRLFLMVRMFMGMLRVVLPRFRAMFMRMSVALIVLVGVLLAGMGMRVLVIHIYSSP